jgi:hypothetical protein
MRRGEVDQNSFEFRINPSSMQAMYTTEITKMAIFPDTEGALSSFLVLHHDTEHQPENVRDDHRHDRDQNDENRDGEGGLADLLPQGFQRGSLLVFEKKVARTRPVTAKASPGRTVPETRPYRPTTQQDIPR